MKILKEKINCDRLEKILNCGNLPFSGEKTKSEYDSIKTRLYNLSKAEFKNGYTEINYYQKRHIGRYCGNGVQTVSTKIKQYICADENGSYYHDLDMGNAHLVILKNKYEEYELEVPAFLEEYCNDREGCMEKYKLKSKKDIIMLINNKKNKYTAKYQQPIIDFHYSLYNEFFNFIKEEYKFIYDDCDEYYNREKKKKSDDNLEGSFIAKCLQHIENDILEIMCGYLKNKGLKVGVFMFDGCMVEKDKSLTKELLQELLKELEARILYETGYEIKLIEKNMNTNWVPIASEDNINKQQEELTVFKEKSLTKYSFRYAKGLTDLIGDERHPSAYKDFIEYVNNFLFCINYPFGYFYRLNTADEHVEDSLGAIKNRFNKYIVERWIMADNIKAYNNSRFCPDSEDREYDCDTMFNVYKPPPFKLTSEWKYPLFKEMLELFTHENDEDYFYLINWLAKAVQRGCTLQGLVFISEEMGTGKSTLCSIMRKILGFDYYNAEKDMTLMTASFNSELETSLLTVFEEVNPEAGKWTAVQNIMKTWVTEQDSKIKKKFKNNKGVKLYNNLIICSNFPHPINIDKYNRRFFISKVNPRRINDWDFFKSVLKEIDDNLEEIRGYFRNYKYTDNLNSIRRTTELELEVKELSLHIGDKFIKEELPLMFLSNYNRIELDSEDENEEEDVRLRNYISYQSVWNEYLEYVKDECGNGSLKSGNKSYFSQKLKKHGYEVFGGRNKKIKKII